MAYIYKITNDINQKVYVGKTEFSIEKRFIEHCQEAQRPVKQHRPLYAAMRKYGIEHFHIELLEETDNPNERETFWIEQLKSFKYGYNATLGGDGKRYIDYDLVIATYLEVHNASEVARILGIDHTSVGDIIRSHGIKSLWDRKQASQQAQEKYGKKCAMLNSKGEVLKTFSSLKEAARYVISENLSRDKEKGISAHISNVCKGTRKTAYGYQWKLI